jgi:hypothetical protein
LGGFSKLAHVTPHVVKGDHAKAHAFIGTGGRQRLRLGRQRKGQQQLGSGGMQEGEESGSHAEWGIERFMKTLRCRSRTPS